MTSRRPQAIFCHDDPNDDAESEADLMCDGIVLRSSMRAHRSEAKVQAANPPPSPRARSQRCSGGLLHNTEGYTH
eukprot:3473181-Rhodomonas_salina.2